MNSEFLYFLKENIKIESIINYDLNNNINTEIKQNFLVDLDKIIEIILQNKSKHYLINQTAYSLGIVPKHVNPNHIKKFIQYILDNHIIKYNKQITTPIIYDWSKDNSSIRYLDETELKEQSYHPIRKSFRDLYDEGLITKEESKSIKNNSKIYFECIPVVYSINSSNKVQINMEEYLNSKLEDKQIYKFGKLSNSDSFETPKRICDLFVAISPNPGNFQQINLEHSHICMEDKDADLTYQPKIIKSFHYGSSINYVGKFKIHGYIIKSNILDIVQDIYSINPKDVCKNSDMMQLITKLYFKIGFFIFLSK